MHLISKLFDFIHRVLDMCVWYVLTKPDAVFVIFKY